VETPQVEHARTVGVALVALITAAGLPLVWALPVGPSGALALLGRPALLWPALLLPDPWARAARAASLMLWRALGGVGSPGARQRPPMAPSRSKPPVTVA
jgi:hypothetical protein